MRQPTFIRPGTLQPERVTSELVRWEDAADALAAPSLKPVVVRAPYEGSVTNG